jgi:hypothetical protein
LVYVSTTDQRTIDVEANRADRVGRPGSRAAAAPTDDDATGRATGRATGQATGHATDEGTGDPTGAGSATWAVPGVDRSIGHTAAVASAPSKPARGSDGTHLTDLTEGHDRPHSADNSESADGAECRESPEAAQRAVLDWRRELGSTVDGGAEPAGHVHPVIAAMATCLEAMDGIREAGVGTLTAREIRLMLLAVVQVITAAFALKLRLLVAGEAQRVADLTGATCTAAFLAHLTQSNRPDATSEVRLARELDGKYRLLAGALAGGGISREQVKECVTALRRLPADLPVDQVRACERFLVEAAQTMTPRQLKIVGRKLWEVIDPDGADAKDGEALDDEERLARAKAYFRSWRNGDGTTGFRGKLPDAQADMLLKLLHALAAPRRQKNPNIPTGQPDNSTRPDEDPSTSDAGTHDAGSSDASTTDAGPNDAGSNDADLNDPDLNDPDLNDPGSGDADTDDTAPGCPVGERLGAGGQGGHQPPDPPGGGRERGDPGSCDGSPADACLDEDSAEEEATGRTVPYPVRLGHALMDLVERIPAAAFPDSAGAAASVVVTIGEEQLRTGVGVATLDTGTAVSAGQIRRLACAAGLIPMVLDGRSEPLDVGREQRLHTRYQRLAASHRQGGVCGIAGCDRPITDYHHPIPWSSGGKTSVANCLGVCGYHHHLAHHPQWLLIYDGEQWTFRRLTEQ